MIKHKKRIIAGAIIAAVLVFIYWWGGNAPGLRGWNPQSDEESSISQIQTPTPSPTASPFAKQIQMPKSAPTQVQPNVSQITATEADKPVVSEKSTIQINEATGKDEYRTDPVTEGRPVPIEPQDVVISDKELTCTLSIRCDTVLENIAWLDDEKLELVPQDGVIFAEKAVTFYEGESVFNLLVRETKRNKIHMEFVNTPIYNSAYIEGIGNIYEFDCGELSGWMYKVNDWFPNYGCSRYQLKAGDKVEWVYTCDLGTDVGGHYSTKNGM